MKKIVLLLALFVLFFGCPFNPEPPKELPEDFEVEYSSGATHLEWGQYSLKIDSKGKAVFEKSIETSMKKSYEFTVTESERKKIYDAVVLNNFFNLNEKYEDPMIMDGGWSKIKITANGNTKTVITVNASNEQFEKVENEIGRLITHKIGEKAFDFTDFVDDCGEKEIACNGKDTIECSEWSYYCAWGENNLEQFSPEYCDLLENRTECIEHCLDEECSEELCETLRFEPLECDSSEPSCEAGCCGKCNNLDSCKETSGCEIAWIHPEGESWQFGGCNNANLCMGSEEICNYLSLSYQGYRYTSLIEENQELASLYAEKSNTLQDLYNAECE
ncbi:hypothetical protein KKG83_07430 [Candidatus Micrarchaeota archaeon]|nr:hypothetical protein [Candidatus Micrarchaeota archaeon]MBU2477271.1 hypothetical protein [Candidatus Micrarchaeota archaeon]